MQLRKLNRLPGVCSRKLSAEVPVNSEVPLQPSRNDIRPAMNSALDKARGQCHSLVPKLGMGILKSAPSLPGTLQAETSPGRRFQRAVHQVVQGPGSQG